MFFPSFKLPGMISCLNSFHARILVEPRLHNDSCLFLLTKHFPIFKSTITFLPEIFSREAHWFEIYFLVCHLQPWIHYVFMFTYGKQKFLV